MKPYSFYSVNTVPKGAGLYAWYYKPNLLDKDIRDCVDCVSKSQELTQGKECLRRYLEKYLFSAYAETPYRATVEGALKPRYEGNLEYIPGISGSLLDRFSDAPDKIYRLKEILQEIVPLFSSPIYIGMTNNLKNRLGQHTKAVEYYRSVRDIESPEQYMSEELSALPTEERKQISRFGREVGLVRGLDPNNLFVYVLKLNADLAEVRAEAENILNRINYPLCGRN